MTYRASAVVEPALERPPQIFGFALYVMGTGVLVMGLAQILMAAMLHHVGWNMGPAIRWGMPVGEVMTALGLAIAWRTTKGRGRRLLAVAGALWVTLFVLDFQRVQVRTFFVQNLPSASNMPYVAMWAGWAMALSVVAVVVFRGGRAFAARTWATLLGSALVTSHAFEQAWPILSPLRRPILWSTVSLVPGLVVLGGVGLVVFAGGLYAAGRNILRGVTVDEYVRAGSKKRHEPSPEDESDVWTPALRRGLPLLVDASVAVSGLAAALAVAVGFASMLHVSPRDLTDTAIIGGQLVASALLVIAVRRLGRLGSSPVRWASAALASVAACLALQACARSLGWFAAYDVLRYVNVVPSLLLGGTLWATAKALGTFTGRQTGTFAVPDEGPLQVLRSRLRAAAVSLAASGAAVFLVTHTADPGARYAMEVIGVIGGGFALASTIGAAREVRRIEVALAAPATSER